MSDTLPVKWLRARRDEKWEMDQDIVRVGLALEWAEPLLVRVQAAMAMGAEMEEDDQFSALTDELYNGLRQRLTRQDLLWVAMMFLHHRTEGQVDNIMERAGADLESLESPEGMDRLLGSS